MMLKQVQTSSTARQSASLAPRAAPALAARPHAPSMSKAAASAPQRRRASIAVRAESSSPPAKSAFAKVSDSMGMPTDDGIFGFTPFAEMWVGRWSMLGFVSSIVVEFVTGRGTLQQVGLPSPSAPMLIGILAIAGGATIAGTVNTALRASGKKMSKSEVSRYKEFLGLNKEDDWKFAAMAMKQQGDFTSPGNDMKAVAESKAAGAPVDSFLSTKEVSEGSAAAAEMKAEEAAPSTPTATADRSQQTLRQAEDTMYFGESGELAYARSIELANGRWAMVGFFAAIVVEAATGQGIIGQLILLAKWSGLLGEKSGF